MRPVHAPAVGGNQTSNFISESEVGLAVPWTRQNGTVTATPPIVAGGGVGAGARLLRESGGDEIRAPQSTPLGGARTPHPPALNPTPRRRRSPHPCFDPAL